MPIIDLNADVGEECGDDATLLNVVTSANVAAGGHAGGDEVLRATVEQCARRDVAVGAHPSYPDRANFGRLSMKGEYDVTHLTEVLRHQIRAVATACSAAGTSLTHVKAHGALYHDAASDDAIAESFIAAVTKVSTEIGADLYVTGAAGSRLLEVAEASSIRFVAEAFVDRAYNTDGTLVPRSQAGAVHDDLPVSSTWQPEPCVCTQTPPKLRRWLALFARNSSRTGSALRPSLMVTRRSVTRCR
jgi:UPF0271 protein